MLVVIKDELKKELLDNINQVEKTMDKLEKMLLELRAELIKLD